MSATTADGGQRRIGRTVGESVEAAPDRPTAPQGAPNVVVILLDDVGFAHYSCFGSSVRTPNIDRLAAEGLRYTDFHTTAVCSPTRASLLTGRNCHSVGFGHVTERVAGYPGYSMRLPDSAATVAEVLRQNGYSTRAVGKWHLTPAYETGPQGPFDRWPIGRGFERFYGFLGGSTDQFAPELVRDNSPVPVKERGADYHLSGDLVDEAITQLRDLRAMAPNRPFFLYLAFGAGHAPHQAPREWIDGYRGAFDDGWDVERERILARQIDSGVMPPGTQLGQSNPGVERWADLPPEQQRLFARMMEVYAGFLSYTDAQIGRLLDFLDEAGVGDDTLILLLSDNGASGEGGPAGSVDEGQYINDRPQLVEDALVHVDELGGPRLYNHYPWGWAQAGNTPFRWYKQFTHAGGITNGLLLRWRNGGVPAGEIRSQYHHVIDLTPTILDVAGIPAPARVNGTDQMPMHGVSMRYSFASSDAPGHRHGQHYEMWGNRGMWREGWMAVCRLQPDAPGAFPPAPMRAPFDELPWELYDHRSDPTEREDLAPREPGVLRALVEEWWAAAGRYDVLPVDDRHRSRRWPSAPPRPAGAGEGMTVFLGPGGPYERGVAPGLAGRSFDLVAAISCDGTPTGVLYVQGGLHGGYFWYLQDGEMVLEVAVSSIHAESARAPLALGAGRHVLEARLSAAADLTGAVEFFADGERIGGGSFTALLKRMPIGSGRGYVGSTPAGSVSGALRPPAALDARLERLVVRPGAPAGAAPPPEPEVDVAAELREQ